MVTAAVRQKPDALVGVEVSVHTDCVFVDGRIAAGPGSIDIEKIARDVYRAAVMRLMESGSREKSA
jgi:S-adenosylmethionine synthetase